MAFEQRPGLSRGIFPVPYIECVWEFYSLYKFRFFQPVGGFNMKDKAGITLRLIKKPSSA